MYTNSILFQEEAVYWLSVTSGRRQEWKSRAILCVDARECYCGAVVEQRRYWQVVEGRRFGILRKRYVYPTYSFVWLQTILLSLWQRTGLLGFWSPQWTLITLDILYFQRGDEFWKARRPGDMFPLRCRRMVVFLLKFAHSFVVQLRLALSIMHHGEGLVVTTVCHRNDLRFRYRNNNQ